MPISQLSVFLESRPGHLARILETFQRESINVRGYSASDTGDYGVVRFIVDKPNAALDVLKRQGCAVVISEVVCIRLNDRPGELSRIMHVLASAEINVVYSYSLISTYIALSLDDVARACAVLEAAGISETSLDDISLPL